MKMGLCSKNTTPFSSQFPLTERTAFGTIGALEPSGASGRALCLVTFRLVYQTTNLLDRPISTIEHGRRKVHGISREAATLVICPAYARAFCAPGYRSARRQW